MEPRVIDLQLSYFFADTSQIGYSQLAVNLKHSCEFLTGENNENIISLPGGAPDDIPRLIVNSVDGVSQISFTKTKVNYILRGLDSSNLSELMDTLVQRGINLTNFFYNESHWRVLRIGVIANVKYDLSTTEQTDARRFIVQRFMSDGVYGTSDPREMLIRMVWRGTELGLNSNYVVQFGRDENDINFLHTMFDLNTTQDQVANGFGFAQINHYIRDASNRILTLPREYQLGS